MSDIKHAITQLLYRREHSQCELRIKLARRGFDDREIERNLAEFESSQLQSDARYAHSLCRRRITLGYGPIRIYQELKMKGVESSIIDKVLQDESIDWVQHGSQLLYKKKLSCETKDARQKTKRFLLYKGFPADLVNQIVSNFHEV